MKKRYILHYKYVIGRVLSYINLFPLFWFFYYKIINLEFASSNPDTLTAIYKALRIFTKNLNSQKGNYYEFGLFRGYTFWYAQKSANMLGLKKMKFYGFDSFAGLPKIEKIDEHHAGLFKGQYKVSKNQVIRNLDKYGVDRRKTFLIKGWYEKCLTAKLKEKNNLRDAVVILIDCDLYSSTVPILNFLKDLFLDNSIILFDDWNLFGKNTNLGQQKAFSEFLVENKRFKAKPLFTFGWHGQAFKINKTN